MSGLHDCSTGSVFQIRSCSLSHIPPTLGCTLTTIILMFVLHTHMQTQAKKKKCSTCASTNANESRSVYAPKHTETQTLKQPSRLYLYKQWFAGVLQPTCFSVSVLPFFFCGLKQQLSRSCRSFSASVSLFPSLSLISFCHPRFSPSRCPLSLSQCFSVCLPLDMSHYQRW